MASHDPRDEPWRPPPNGAEAGPRRTSSNMATADGYQDPDGQHRPGWNTLQEKLKVRTTAQPAGGGGDDVPLSLAAQFDAIKHKIGPNGMLRKSSMRARGSEDAPADADATRRHLAASRKGSMRESNADAVAETPSGDATPTNDLTGTRGGRRSMFHQKMKKAMANMTLKAPGKRHGLKNLSQEERHEELLQLVESTMENNDLMPLVRFVFENAAGAGQQPAPGQAFELTSPDARVTNPSLVAAQRALKQVMQQEGAVINSWCKKNASQMNVSVKALADIGKQADAMEAMLSASNKEMQAEGKKLLEKVQELHMATQVGSNVAKASDTVNSVLHIVQRLMQAVQHVQNGLLHPAMQILDILRVQHPELFQYPVLPSEVGELSAGQHALLTLTSKAVNGLQVAIQEQARRDFHEWLAATRQTAKTIGERAVRRAQADRLHEDVLAHERKMLQSRLLETKLDLKAGRELVLEFIANEDPLYGRASIKHKRSSNPSPPKIDVRAQFGDSSLLRRVRRHSVHQEGGRDLSIDSSDIAVSLLEGFDMSGLHRCIHVHQMLGAMQSFSTYYLEQRRLQLLSDVTPPGQVLETYKAYLAQLTGFFITEEKVLSSTANLITKQQVQQLWQTAVTAIKNALDSGFDQIRNAAAMFVVKDYVLLTAETLANHNFDVSPMMDILLMNRERYHDLLNSEAALVIRDTLRGDIDAALIHTEDDLDRYIYTTGLPASMSSDADAPIPALPFIAPFSRGLTTILQVIEGYICDSVRFQKGLLSPSEVLIAAREHRDRFVCRLVCDFFQNHVTYLLSVDHNLKPLMMMAANAWCLKRVLNDLEEYTVVMARGGGDHGEKELLLIAREQSQSREGKKLPECSLDGAGSLQFLNTSAMVQAISNLQENIEREIHAAMAVTIRNYVMAGAELDWAPDSPPTAATSAYVEDLLKFLDGGITFATQYLPEASRVNFLRSAMNEMDTAITQLLVSSGVPAWNRHGMQRLSDDIAALQQFAIRHKYEGQANPLHRAQDLTDFIFLEDWKRATSLAVLHAGHPHVDPLQLAAVLRKYQPVQLSYLERMRLRNSADRTQWTKSELVALAKQIEAAVAKGEY